jgi:hypothetical protein
MRVAVAAIVALGTVAGAQAAPPPPAPLSVAEQEIDICMRAAAVTDHVAVKEVDKSACECATSDLHKNMRPADFELHERMLEVIASGADKKSFDKQMSDIMLARGMNQHDVDAFLARSKTAENKAQDDCNASIMLDPVPKKNEP